MAEFKNKKGASLRLAVFHILLYHSLAGWETTGAQLAPVLNKIGNGDGISGAQVTEKMLAQVFGSANNILCLKYSELGIEEGGGKSVTIEKNRGGIIFKVITNTSISPSKPPGDHPFEARTCSWFSGIVVPKEVIGKLKLYLKDRLRGQLKGQKQKVKSKGGGKKRNVGAEK